MPRGRLTLLHRGLSVIALVLIGASLTAVPARAAPSIRPSTGDTLSLQLANGSTFIYAGQPGGTPAPKFTATLVLAAAPTANRFIQINLTIGGQSYGNASPPTVSQDRLTYTASIDTAGTAIPAGSQTASASYFNPDTNTTTHSNSLSVTIGKATPQLQCTIVNGGYLIDPGQTLGFQMTFTDEGSSAPVDWQNSTSAIQFNGTNASNVVLDPNLTHDGNDVVTVRAPVAYDWYMRIFCIFNGSANFNSATAAIAQTLLVSAKHPLGAVHFASNPWPLVSNQITHVTVTFDAAPGGPVPNGNFSIQVGTKSTVATPVGPNGVTSGTLAPISGIDGVTQLLVYYQGDPYYNAGSVAFPMTSSPSGGSGGSSGSGGSATPRATLTPTRTASTSSARTPSSTSTQTTASPTGAHASKGTPPPASAHVQPADHTTAVILGSVAAVLILLGGGVGGWLYFTRRATSRFFH